MEDRFNIIFVSDPSDRKAAFTGGVHQIVEFGHFSRNMPESYLTAYHLRRASVWARLLLVKRQEPTPFSRLAASVTFCKLPFMKRKILGMTGR